MARGLSAQPRLVQWRNGRAGMPNHPNRGEPTPYSNPAPAAIQKARIDLGLTQTEAAHLVLSSAAFVERHESA
jgi:hypothetical protein